MIHATAKVLKFRKTESGTEFIIHVPEDVSDFVIEKCVKEIGIKIDDGRTISRKQQKKAYAIIKDIASWCGHSKNEVKEIMKVEYMNNSGNAYFSLSDVCMDTARGFIDYMLIFAVINGVELHRSPKDICEDINRWLYASLVKRFCCVHATPGEVHHVDAIGMGRNRITLDDSGHRKICLCRECHKRAHDIGMTEFEKENKVHGILFDDKERDNSLEIDSRQFWFNIYENMEDMKDGNGE